MKDEWIVDHFKQIKMALTKTFPVRKEDVETKRQPSAWDLGYRAANRGAECWENPYVLMGGAESIGRDTVEWHAGWCFGMQNRERHE